MRRIAYYVTAHGFGHATRTSAVIEALLGRGAERIFVHLVTDVPPWIFRELTAFEGAFRIRSKTTDVGLVQKDGLSIDFSASASLLAQHLRNFDAAAIEEARFLCEEKIDLVLTDIPAVPFLAANLAGVPSIGVSNFGWDCIYRGYVDRDPIFGEAVERFQSAYRTATALFRLPFATPMESFRGREDMPLVVRHARTVRNEMRTRLGFDRDPRPIVLVCFGGFGVSTIDERRFFADDSSIILAFGHDPGTSAGHVRFIGKDEFYFPDLVNVADVLVSKPGYGMVAESIAHQTPFLYAPRDDFAETPHLIRALEAFVPSKATTMDSLATGYFLEEAASLIGPRADVAPIATDGAQAIATRIIERLG